MLNNALSSLRRGVMQKATLHTISNGLPVAINGISRIGKSVLRQSFKNDVNIVAVNQPHVDIKAVANILKYDTVHGVFDKNITIYGDTLCIDGRHVKVFHEENPEKIPWKNLVEYVIDSSGTCDEEQKAIKHIKAGAKKVLVTALSKDIPMFVKGVNFDSYQKSTNTVSCGSSTGNCATPLVKALHKQFGILNCMMTTTHPLSPVQHIHDGLGFRAATENIMPVSTGDTAAICMTIPDLKGKVHGDANTVPVLNVSLLKLFINVKEKVTVDAVKEKIVCLSKSDLKGVLSYCDHKLVSSDLIGCQYSGIVDLNQIQAIDKLISIGVWYDNEVGYASRVLDLVKHMANIDVICVGKK